jgi:hypothetical protein
MPHTYRTGTKTKTFHASHGYRNGTKRLSKDYLQVLYFGALCLLCVLVNVVLAIFIHESDVEMRNLLAAHELVSVSWPAANRPAHRLELCIDENGEVLNRNDGTATSLSSALVGGECSVSRPCRFTPEERTPGIRWIGGLLDPRAGLDDVEKRKFLNLPGLELRSHGRAARSRQAHMCSG